MNKLYQKEPLYLQPPLDFEKLYKKYHCQQRIVYPCQKCGIPVNNKLRKIKEKGIVVLCKKCSIVETCLRKYGIENPLQLESVKEKYKQTCLKKYGVENPFQSKKIQEKRKQTCLEKYGVENPTYTMNHNEKVKKAWSNKSEEEKLLIKRKREKTLSNMHGSLEEAYKIRSEKIKQTCLEKYGVEHPWKNSKIKEKIKQTMLRKYGTVHVNYKYHYLEEQFDSSWELAVWLWAKSLKKNIKREPIGLEYVHEGKTHIYYPDFEIDGRLIEVKGPQFFKEDGTMQNPFNHSQDKLFEAKHQCGLKHGVEFWSEKEMKPILEQMYMKYKNFEKFKYNF